MVLAVDIAVVINIANPPITFMFVAFQASVCVPAEIVLCTVDDVPKFSPP